MELITRLDGWFAEQVKTLGCSPDTRAYVVGVLSRFKDTSGDMSSTSMVLAFAEARERGSFEAYQRMGDWSLWVGSVHPGTENWPVVETLGRLSYMRCDAIMGRKWKVYAELAERLPTIVCETRRLILQR